MSIDRLLRESNPPAGMLASPVPQYEDVSTGEPGAVKGRDGAPFSMLLGPDGQPIDPSNPLEVRVRELETELQELRQLLQSGDTKVQLTGHDVQVIRSSNQEASSSNKTLILFGTTTERIVASDAPDQHSDTLIPLDVRRFSEIWLRLTNTVQVNWPLRYEIYGTLGFEPGELNNERILVAAGNVGLGITKDFTNSDLSFDATPYPGFYVRCWYEGGATGQARMRLLGRRL